MVYGALNRFGEEYYTSMSRIFAAIKGRQTEYNWLISAVDCAPENVAQLCADTGYCWLSGEELSRLVSEDDSQWVWAVLSGFTKDIPLSEVLRYKLPYADGYGGFWENPLTLQHPLATVEIVPWDSSLTLLLSTQENLVRDFRTYFPMSEDLAGYNASYLFVEFSSPQRPIADNADKVTIRVYDSTKGIDYTGTLPELLAHEDIRVRFNAATTCLNLDLLQGHASSVLRDIAENCTDPALCFTAKLVLQANNK